VESSEWGVGRSFPALLQGTKADVREGYAAYRHTLQTRFALAKLGASS